MGLPFINHQKHTHVKIISKFKDFYDYLQGIYGVDEKRVLERTPYDSTTMIGLITDLNFCGTVYRRYSRETWEEDIGRHIKSKRPRWLEWKLPRDFRKWTLMYEDENMVWYRTNIRKEGGIPYFVEGWNGVELFPILEKLGWPKVMNARDTYLSIESFLAFKEPDMPSDPTDMNRFENKGFDSKTSFRNIK